MSLSLNHQVPGSWAAAWRRGALGAKPPPVYLQYNTHSITVVGALRESAGGKTSLLVLCPVKASAPGALGSDKWQVANAPVNFIGPRLQPTHSPLLHAVSSPWHFHAPLIPCLHFQ